MIFIVVRYFKSAPLRGVSLYRSGAKLLRVARSVAQVKCSRARKEIFEGRSGAQAKCSGARSRALFSAKSQLCR